MPQVSASPLIGGGLTVSSPALTSSLPGHSVPSLVPTSVTSAAFPLLSPVPSRSLPSHSPPLSLTQPPRPPSSPSPAPLIVKDREVSSRLISHRDIEVRDVKSDRDILLRDRDRERDRERDDVSPPCSQGGDHPGAPTSPLQLTPVLVESQIQRIAETAAALVKSLPVAELEPKQPNAKKKICKELEVSKLIISLGDSYPLRRENLILQLTFLEEVFSIVGLTENYFSRMWWVCLMKIVKKWKKLENFQQSMVVLMQNENPRNL